MGVTLCMLRMQEDLNLMYAKQQEVLDIKRTLRKLTNFSSAIADGTITPTEIASIGNVIDSDGFFWSALDFMESANEVATEVAAETASYYEEVYSGITSEEYYQNSSLYSEAELYFDEDGNLDTDAIAAEIYAETLQDYAEEEIAPRLSEYEEELESKKDTLETEYEELSAEYDALKEQRSTEIQRQAISLS